jgi:glycosyltransferase involved in cell wall biosynthesis
MMCGTPVVAMRLGAVPEIVDEAVTGYSATSAEEFTSQLARALTLSRRGVRERAEVRFSPERMARQYLEVYQRGATHG